LRSSCQANGRYQQVPSLVSKKPDASSLTNRLVMSYNLLELHSWLQSLGKLILPFVNMYKVHAGGFAVILYLVYEHVSRYI
jgi:hypothetical protein